MNETKEKSALAVGSCFISISYYECSIVSFCNKYSSRKSSLIVQVLFSLDTGKCWKFTGKVLEFGLRISLATLCLYRLLATLA